MFYPSVYELVSFSSFVHGSRDRAQDEPIIIHLFIIFGCAGSLLLLRLFFRSPRASHFDGLSWWLLLLGSTGSGVLRLQSLWPMGSVIAVLEV